MKVKEFLLVMGIPFCILGSRLMRSDHQRGSDIKEEVEEFDSTFWNLSEEEFEKIKMVTVK